MAVNVETLEKLERKIVLTLPADSIKSEVDSRLKRLAQTVKMDGFRPGKVPFNIIEQRYGYSVNFEVMNDKVGQLFSEAANEAKLRVAGQPRITEKEPTSTGELTFEAIFEVFPEVKFGDLSGVEIEKMTTQVSDDAVEKTLEILRKQRRTFAQRGLDAQAQDTDRVTINFEGKIDGEPFAGGKADDFQFLVGDGQMLKEFEDAVRGMKVGESKTFPLNFPADYQGQEVAGKQADFMVTLNKLEAAQLPALDDAFAKSLGVAGATVEALRADIKKNLDREAQARVLARNKKAAMDALLANAELELPQAVVQGELANLIAQARERLKQRGIKDADKAPIPEEMLRPQAESRVRLGLVIAELARANDLYPKSEQVQAHLEELAANYEKPQDVIRWYTGDTNRMADVESALVEKNVTDFVLGKAKIVEKTLAFDELMQQG